MAHSLVFLQEQLGYFFQDESRLKRCFQAAHRSDLDGTADDGNRGMAQFGQSLMEAVELQSSIDVGSGARHAAHQRTAWVKSKERRAAACDRMGISHLIVRSVRQGDNQPSKTTRAQVISAIIAAVFHDLWAQRQAVDVVWQVLGDILGRISAQTNGDLVVSPEEVVIHRQSVPDIAGPYPLTEQRDIPPEHLFSITPAPTVMPDKEFSATSGRSVITSAKRGGSSADLGRDLDQAQIDWDWESAFQTDSATTANNTCNPPACSPTVESAIGHSRKGDSGGDRDPSADSVRTTITAKSSQVVGSRRGRSQNSEEREELRKQLVQLDLTKTTTPTERQRTYRYLEIGDISLRLDTPQIHVVRLFHYYIGSTHSVIAWQAALRHLRGRGQDLSFSSPGPISALAHLKMAEELHHQSAINTILARLHILKAFEEDLPQAASSFVNQSQSTFDTPSRQCSGNARLKATTALINARMKVMYPKLRVGSGGYHAKRKYLMRLFKLAKCLYIFAERFGYPVIVLLPYPDQSGLYFSDSMLRETNLKTLQICVDLLQSQQGFYLTQLCGRIQDDVESLVDGSFHSRPPGRLESCSKDVIENLVKGSTLLMDCV